ncbi:hypothetical protein LP085_08655 [Achromobacter sp. MY14]|uniref:hypothetical protein n=1 Tax=unclassified Achromobacter TaxID=2626865 RepID=UPI001E426E70|nr:hypothetical protein [Achromobacter sp. MY14]MCD0496914.1 hypothetical protein [Achromobacter sp. MY14]
MRSAREQARRPWPDIERVVLRTFYLDAPTAAISAAFGLPMPQVHGQARKLGLAQSAAYHRPVNEPIRVECAPSATPNRDALPISLAAAVNIARLASLRMWDAYALLEMRDAA